MRTRYMRSISTRRAKVERTRQRKSVLLGTALVSAFLVAAAQAAPALANPWYIQTKAPGTTAQLLNASGCGNPAQIVQWPYTPGATCRGGGSNQLWRTTNGDWPINTTRTAIYASYGGADLCMNIKDNDYASGTPVIAYRCNPSAPTGNELFFIHAWPGGYYIQPVDDTALCLNVQGGFGQGHPIILYGCSVEYSNEKFLPDRT